MDDVRESLAAALWKEEGRPGTPSIYGARTPDAFRDQSDEIRNRWFRFADAAIAAITPASDDRAEGLREAAEIVEQMMGEWAAATYQNPEARMQNAAKTYAAGDIMNAILAARRRTGESR